MGAAEYHFSEWLRFSPCRFARFLNTHEHIRPVELLEPLHARDVAGIEATLDEAARDKRVGLVLWPMLRTAEHIVELLRVFDECNRWSCQRVPWGAHAREDAVLLGLNWKTPAGDLSSVMGFAPLGSMPVTRRAPYVAIAVWPGGHENTHPKYSSPEGKVGFVDCKMPDKDHDYDHLWKQTRDEVCSLLASPPPDDNRTLREVAFCLPVASVGAAFP